MTHNHFDTFHDIVEPLIDFLEAIKYKIFLTEKNIFDLN